MGTLGKSFNWVGLRLPIFRSLICHLILSMLIGFHANATRLPGNDLLTYFSANCPSQGEWTKVVLSDAESLTNVLASIKNDPDCQTVSGSIAQLNNLAQRVASLKADSELKIEIEKLRAKEFELNNQLASTQNTQLSSSLCCLGRNHRR